MLLTNPREGKQLTTSAPVISISESNCISGCDVIAR